MIKNNNIKKLILVTGLVTMFVLSSIQPAYSFNATEALKEIEDLKIYTGKKYKFDFPSDFALKENIKSRQYKSKNKFSNPFKVKKLYSYELNHEYNHENKISITRFSNTEDKKNIMNCIQERMKNERENYNIAEKNCNGRSYFKEARCYISRYLTNKKIFYKGECI